MSAETLLNEVYQELRRLASHLLAHEKPGQTLQPTALVNEAYLKIQASYPQLLAGTDPRGFYACAAESMRRILVDKARYKKALKRGGKEPQRVALEQAEFALPESEVDTEALSEAITRLEAHDPVAAEVVKLRYFVGMKMQQVADTLGQSLSSTNRQWRYAKAWLKDYLDSPQNSDTT